MRERDFQVDILGRGDWRGEERRGESNGGGGK
jgi:hypothetical protein